MKSYSISIILFLLLFSFIIQVNAKDNIRIIKENFHKIYVLSENQDTKLEEVLKQNEPGFIISDRVVMELQQRVPYNQERINRYVSQIGINGQWNDIDYNDKKRSGWEPRLHCERILEMVKAFENPELDVYHSKVLENTIRKAMSYWFVNRPVCSNWYYNEIGVPRTMGIAFVLFDKHLTSEERINAIEVMKSSNFGMTGQNKVWLAGNVMMRGLLENNISLIKEARDTIVSEITYGGYEGIKYDWSFHQHGSMQQFGNYGLAYIYTLGLMSGILSNTELTLEDKSIDILMSFINKGYQWIIWNGKMDVNALGRQFFSSSTLHKALSLAYAAQELSKCNNKGQDEKIDSFINNCYTTKNNLTGIKNFWQSDYTIVRRKSWMASLKMSSKRVIGGESLNGDNMKGYYTGDGVLMLYKDANEYYDIFPLWDWSKLPGITAYNYSHSLPSLADNPDNGNKEEFVGGLDDGKNGISVMQLKRDGLSFDKLWLFHNDVILCLGSNITSNSSKNVITSIEQNHYRNDMEIIKGNTSGLDNTFTGELRVIHNNTGYVVWDNHQRIFAGKVKQKGSWNDIMKMYPDKPISGEVFSLYIDHNRRPKNSSFCYAILPCINKAKLSSFDINDYKIIANNENMQGIYIKKDNIYWLSVKKPIKDINIFNCKVSFDTPGLFSFRINNNSELDVNCSDPTQSLNELQIKINKKNILIELPKKEQKGTSTRIIHKI